MERNCGSSLADLADLLHLESLTGRNARGKIVVDIVDATS
jgi:hypothetical protein